MNDKLISKLPSAGTSIFAVMSKMAVDHKAINLSQGFPDFNCADKLLDLVNHYQRKGFNQYAPMPGITTLRENISVKTQKCNKAFYNPETEITITSGATEALYASITALIHPGDEVIIFEPAYDSYLPAIQLSGGVLVPVPMTLPDFKIDWSAVENKINKKTKMIIINSPHNPSGSVIDEADIKKLESLSEHFSFYILSDEVYEHIIFDRTPHLSISTSPLLKERSIIVSSFGKTFHVTGWKVGYFVAPEIITKEIRKIHQFVVFAVNTPIQYAYADYLKDENTYFHLNDFYQKKRDFSVELFRKTKFKLTPAKGTYFQLLDYSELSDKPDMEFAEYLAKEVGVAVIPLSPFYSGKYEGKLIRICFAKSDEVMTEAAHRLMNA
ncbi:MAG: aminotransferase class I/II-fold pyridoxal phosphate-dependent enzyme [Ignavibacteriales bacterium]|nr:MAG: aminotransferase class I/II-fold pyridoxal phosphate-dependent enzyme [Ignavibacteriales bacterium]